MSGGSYDYLCHKSGSELAGARHSLDCMQQTLAQLGYADDAAQATQQLLDLIGRLDDVPTALSAVWKAIEWWHSGDSGEDDVHEALAAYRKSLGIEMSEVEGEIGQVGASVIGGDSVYFLTLRSEPSSFGGDLVSIEHNEGDSLSELFRVSIRVSPRVSFARPGVTVKMTVDQPDAQGVRRVFAYQVV